MHVGVGDLVGGAPDPVADAVEHVEDAQRREFRFHGAVFAAAHARGEDVPHALVVVLQVLVDRRDRSGGSSASSRRSATASSRRPAQRRCTPGACWSHEWLRDGRFAEHDFDPGIRQDALEQTGERGLNTVALLRE